MDQEYPDCIFSPAPEHVETMSSAHETVSEVESEAKTAPEVEAAPNTNTKPNTEFVSVGEMYRIVGKSREFLAWLMRLCESPDQQTRQDAFVLLTRMASHPEAALEMVKI